MKLLCKTTIGVLIFISLNVIAKNANQFNYIGINFQNNSYENLNFTPGVDTTQLSPIKYDENSSEIGWRGFVGHQFNRYIAVEAGLTSFGKASFTIAEEQTDSNGKIAINTIQNGEFKTLACDIRAVGTYPISNSLFLRAQIGVLAWDNEFTYLVDTEGLTAQKDSDKGVSLLTGVGIAYGFNDLVAISLDYEKTEIAKITTQSLGVSLLVRF